jgi:hypothetical protein
LGSVPLPNTAPVRRDQAVRPISSRGQQNRIRQTPIPSKKGGASDAAGAIVRAGLRADLVSNTDTHAARTRTGTHEVAQDREPTPALAMPRHATSASARSCPGGRCRTVAVLVVVTYKGGNDTTRTVTKEPLVTAGNSW